MKPNAACLATSSRIRKVVQLGLGAHIPPALLNYISREWKSPCKKGFGDSATLTRELMNSEDSGKNQQDEEEADTSEYRQMNRGEPSHALIGRFETPIINWLPTARRLAKDPQQEIANGRRDY